MIDYRKYWRGKVKYIKDGIESDNSKAGCWVEGCSLIQDPDTPSTCIEGFTYYNNDEGPQRVPYSYFVESETVCQCTGCLDVGGTPIFVNDIVEDENGLQYMIQEVDTGVPTFILINSIGSSAVDLGKVKVIGNSFDNPEMVELFSLPTLVRESLEENDFPLSPLEDLVNKIVEKTCRIYGKSPRFRDLISSRNINVNVQYNLGRIRLYYVGFCCYDSIVIYSDSVVYCPEHGDNEVLLRFGSFEEFLNI